MVKICIEPLALLDLHNSDDQIHDDLKDFLQGKYPETDLEEIKSKIDAVEIRNIVKGTEGNKILKFNLKLYAFVYKAMIDFHHQFLCAIQLQPTIFFRKVHRLIRVKVRLDHSHTTGKILGYAHDFCNWQIENRFMLNLWHRIS